LSAGNDHDVVTINFCDTIALIANCLDGHITYFAFLNAGSGGRMARSLTRRGFCDSCCTDDSVEAGDSRIATRYVSLADNPSKSDFTRGDLHYIRHILLFDWSTKQRAKGVGNFDH
jgi:hypothetical protein